MNAIRIQKGRIKLIGAVGIFALAVVIVVVFAWHAFGYFAARIHQNTESELLTIMQLKREVIEQFLRERRGDGAVLAARPAIWTMFGLHGAVPPAQVTSLAIALDSTRKAYGYRRIVVFDRARRAIHPREDSEVGPHALDALSRTLTTGQPAFVDLPRDAQSCHCYGMISPVHAGGIADGEVVGAVYLEVDARSHLLPLIKQWPGEGKTTETVLMRKEGDGVLVLVSSEVREGTALPWRQSEGAVDPHLGQRAARGESGIIEDAIDFGGVPVIGVALPVSGTQWVMVAKQDIEEAERPVRDLGIAVVMLAAMFMLSYAAIAYLLWRASRNEWVASHAALAQQYESAVATSIDAFLRVSPDGSILEANESAARLAGRSLDEMKSLALWDLDSAIPREKFPSDLARVRSMKGSRFHSQWRRTDGSIVDVDVSVAFISTDDGGYFQSFVRDITEDLGRVRRLERLNRFHRFMLQVNHDVAGLRDSDEILRAFCDAAVAQGVFALVWAGAVDEASSRVDVRAISGPASAYAGDIRISTDPDSVQGQGPTAIAIRESRTVLIADFLADSRTASWRERAMQFGIRSSAATPILSAGRAVGAVNFYSTEVDAFDAEMVALLEESTRTLSPAFEAGMISRQLGDERALRSDIERRYETIFRESPLPMQLHAVADRALVSINKAHQKLFGWALEEISGLDAWFERAFPDPVFRESLRLNWESAIERARAEGIVVESPELKLRCRDGSDRLVMGHMTIVGGDLIISWSDLTAIRQGEAALRESEGRFRAMVEQMVAGFYVVQDGRFVYVNPGLAGILGDSRDELLGRSPLDFVAADSQAAMLEARDRLDKGIRNVSCSAHLNVRNGARIIVHLQLSTGVWAGSPAIFALVEDITERARSEEKAAQYLKRLEAAMQGTLHAVSRMVDLRDPYTAGHERRVGLVAAAIAREIGWNDERCHTLELLGLVHDIGKVAVPAELLSKPTRLSPTEFELIKNHAQAGYEILKDVEFNGLPVGEIIRQHHERLDGRGYPQGLKGDEILPEARILAVADVFESMASHRPYRPALGVEAALAEIAKGRGTVFDAAAVDAVLRLVRDKGYRLPD